MKKTLTVLIAAGAVLGAAGCSAPTFSNEETCARIQSVVATQKSESDKYGMILLANQIRPIEAKASEDLKAPLRAVIAYLDETTKENPDQAKLQQLQADYAAAGQAFNTVCGQ